MKRKKVLILLLVVVLGGGAFAYKTMKKPKIVHMKIAGITYVLPTPFLLNLSDGQYAKLTVALELAPGQSDGVTAASAGASATTSDIGTLPEEAEIRAIVTDVITNSSSTELLGSRSRNAVEKHILSLITQDTDDKVDQVIFTDLTIQ
jgi:flagellar FliL protein